jgi:hypothetical protein
MTFLTPIEHQKETDVRELRPSITNQYMHATLSMSLHNQQKNIFKRTVLAFVHIIQTNYNLQYSSVQHGTETSNTVFNQ